MQHWREPSPRVTLEYVLKVENSQLETAVDTKEGGGFEINENERSGVVQIKG